MKIPPYIFVGGHIIDVELVKTDRCKDFGVFDHWYRKIKINIDDTKEDVQAEAFLHEIVEAINTIYELDLDHKTLNILSEVLFQIIRRNGLDFRDPIYPLKTALKVS